jgi:hypothetical protein
VVSFFLNTILYVRFTSFYHIRWSGQPILHFIMLIKLGEVQKLLSLLLCISSGFLLLRSKYSVQDPAFEANKGNLRHEGFNISVTTGTVTVPKVDLLILIF